MAYKYSRKTKTEEKKNIKSAIVFGFLSVFFILAFIFFGLPGIAKFAAFLTELRTTKTPVSTTDETPPPPPQLDPLPSYTQELSVEINGSTEPGITVWLFLNNKKEELLTNNEGKFSYEFSLNNGQNTISCLAVDKAGNESKKTQTYTITYDKEPPELTITKPENGSDFYGSKERQIVIEGNTEEGASVNISGRHVVVENDGTFTFTTTLSEGENKFEIKSEDKAGNTTEKTLSVTFTP